MAEQVAVLPINEEEESQIRGESSDRDEFEEKIILFQRVFERLSLGRGCEESILGIVLCAMFLGRVL